MSKEQSISFLVDMGFPRELAAKAIATEGYLEPAIQYCIKFSGGQSLGSTGGTSGGGSEGQALGGTGSAPPRRRHDDDDEADPMDVGAVEEPKPAVEQRKLTPEEAEEKLRQLQEKIKERKAQAAKAEEMSDLDKEKLRRLEGQEAQKAKEDYEKKKADRESYLRKKAKEDDIKARENILAKLAQDKLNKEAELAKKNAPLGQASAPVTPAPVTEAKNYDECVLQIRLPDNSKLQHTFPSNATMAEVVAHIRANAPKFSPSKLILSTTFPRKSYEGASLSTTLKEAELVPRGMLMVTLDQEPQK